MTVDEMRRALGMPATASAAEIITAYAAMTADFAATAPLPEIVTLDDVKDFVRIDGDEEDDLLVLLIEAASETVATHADNWNGQEPVPARIKLAVLTHVASAYTERRDGTDMPASAARLLNPLRRLEI